MNIYIATLLTISLAGAANMARATAPDAPVSKPPSTPAEWAASMAPDSLAAAASACLQSVDTVGATTSVSLSDGTRVDVVSAADGARPRIDTFGGQGELENSLDLATVALPDIPAVPEEVARDQAYLAAKRSAKQALVRLIKERCLAMATKVASAAQDKDAGVPGQDQIKAYVALVRELMAEDLKTAQAAIHAGRQPAVPPASDSAAAPRDEGHVKARGQDAAPVTPRP